MKPCAKKTCLLASALLGLMVLHGCATLDTPRDSHDPWEGFNRNMHSFNDKLDRSVLKPTAKAYRAVTPNPVETGVSNFFANLGDLKNLLNNLMQFKLLEALSDSGRFVLNSTLGIYGLFDVATHMGLEKHNEDFGQTLGAWGIESGPYLVLPFFGPGSVRDSIGLTADYSLDAVRYVEDDSTRNSMYILRILSSRAELLKAGEILDEAAYDPYIYLREAYLQRRRNLVHDGNPPIEVNNEEIDIFSDEDIDIFSD